MAHNRRHRRMQTVLAVHARGPHRIIDGETENLSEGGVFVATDKALEPGTEVDLDLVLPELSEVLKVVAVVRWVRAASTNHAAGMGLEFVELPDDGQLILRKFLKFSEDA